MDRSELWGIRFRDEYLPVDIAKVQTFFGSWQVELVDSYQKDGEVFVYFKDENEAKLIDGSMKGLLRCQMVAPSKKSTTIIHQSKGMDPTITVKVEKFPKEHRDALLLKCSASEPSKLTLNNDELTIRSYFREQVEINQAMKLIEQLMKFKGEQKIKMDVLMERVPDGDETIQDKTNQNNSFTPSLHSTACNGNRPEDTFTLPLDEGEKGPGPASGPVTSLRTVWVGNLPVDATKADLQRIFSDYEICGLHMCNKETHSFGFVELASEEIAQSALYDSKLLNHAVQGRKLSLKVSDKNIRKPNVRPNGSGDSPSYEPRGNFRPRPEDAFRSLSMQTPTRQFASPSANTPVARVHSDSPKSPFLQSDSPRPQFPQSDSPRPQFPQSDSPRPQFPQKDNQPEVGTGDNLKDEPIKEVEAAAAVPKPTPKNYPNSMDAGFLAKLYEKVFNYRGQDLVPLLLEFAKNNATGHQKVMVTEIVDDQHFWATLEGFPERKDMSDQFEGLAKALNTETDYSVKPPESAIGCAAKFENAWYRAWILKRLPECFIVFFVDYGNFAQVPLSDVCALEDDAHWGMPARAIPCRLAGIDGRAAKLQDLEATLCSMAVERYDESTLLVHARLHC